VGDSLTPCWKAFDHDYGTKWRSRDLGQQFTQFTDPPTSSSSSSPNHINSNNPHLIGQDHWIEIDLGAGRGAFPTGLVIGCDTHSIVNSESDGEDDKLNKDRFRNCPRTLLLLGSEDGQEYETIYKKLNITFDDFSLTSDGDSGIGFFSFPSLENK